jgi:hypothetical protein
MNTRISGVLRDALENLAPTDASNAFVETADVGQSDRLIEQSLDATQPALEALQSLDRTMDEHTGVMESLEALAASLEAYGDVALPDSARLVMHTAIESIAADVGDGKSLAALGDELRAEKAQTTTGASGTIRETAKKILQKIWQFLKQLWSRLTDLFHRLLGASAQLKFRAQRLHAALAKHKFSDGPTTNQLDVSADGLSSTVYQSLQVRGVFPTSALATAKALGEAQAAVNTVDNTIADRYALELQLLKAGLASGRIEDLSRQLYSTIAMPAVFKEEKPAHGLSGRTFVVRGLPGDWVIKMLMLPRIYNGVYFGVGYQAYAHQMPMTDESGVVTTMIPVMAAPELEQLSAVVAKLSDGMADGRTLMQRVRKVADEAEPTRLNPAVYTQTGSAMMDNFHKRYREVGRLTILTNTALLKGGLALMRWAEASLEQYPAAA